MNFNARGAGGVAGQGVQAPDGAARIRFPGQDPGLPGRGGQGRAEGGLFPDVELLDEMVGVIGLLGLTQAVNTQILFPVDGGQARPGVPDELPVHELGQSVKGGIDDFDHDDGRIGVEPGSDREGGQAALDFDASPLEAELREMGQGLSDDGALGLEVPTVSGFSLEPLVEETAAVDRAIPSDLDIAIIVLPLEFMDSVSFPVVLFPFELGQVRG